MPRLSPQSMRQSTDRIRELAGVIATETYQDGVLWARYPGSQWFARRNRDEPWVTGHAATGLRDFMIEAILERLEREPQYAGWREFHMVQRSKKYDLLRHVRRTWSDWSPPEDLPS